MRSGHSGCRSKEKEPFVEKRVRLSTGRRRGEGRPSREGGGGETGVSRKRGEEGEGRQGRGGGGGKGVSRKRAEDGQGC